MRSLIIRVSILAGALLCLAQFSSAQSTVIGGSVQEVFGSAPSGACTSGTLWHVYGTNALYGCDNGTIAQIGGAGGTWPGYPSGSGLVTVVSGNAWGTPVALGTLTDGMYCTYSAANGLQCNSAGGSMTWPSATGVMVYAGNNAYGTSLPVSTWLQAANNLSDLGSAATARTNLGLGSAAVQAASYFLEAGNNLSDLGNASTARTNLGLGALATAAAPTGSLVGTGQSNTWTAGTQDFTGAIVKLPVSAGFASTAQGGIGYDSTNKNWHGWLNGADAIFALFATSGITSGDCVKFLKTTNSWSLADAGAACGSGGTGTTTNALTFASTGGASPGASFNGAGAVTVDYHTVGASAAVPNATAETANWTAACNTPYVGNAASGITATLPTIATGCVIPIQNINTGAVTVSSGSANIYQGTTTGASSISIAQGTTVTLWTDGTNWYATKPATGGGGTQTIGLAPASTPSFSPAAGTYSSTQSVTISCTYGAPYYVVAASLPGTAPVTQYSTAVSVASTETLQAGCFGTAYTPTFASAAYTISLPQAATPTFAPVAGTYSSTQSVTISDSTSGSTIYYTTDGTTPTTGSTVYSTPVSVATSETLKAIATASGYTQSVVGSAAYTITGSSCTGTCSDTFSGTSGTLLATHDSSWTDLDSSDKVANCQLDGNGSAEATNSFGDCGAAYSRSTSDTSQVGFGPVVGAAMLKRVCVRASAGTGPGYCLGSNSYSGASLQLNVLKNGAFLSSVGSPIDATVAHTLKIVASGTSNVTLTAYVDGVSIGTVTDSSSPLSAGSPGFITSGAGSQIDTVMEGPWQDH